MRRLVLAGVSLLAMASVAQATVFTSTGQVQTDVITQAGVYSILALGGTGGTGVDTGSGTLVPGGAGALASGQVYLSAGTVLQIVVGGAGGTGNFGSGSCRVPGWWLHHATRAAMRAPRSALPRRRALCTNWKKPR